ncbi:hypothetical protein IFR05_013371 [Cadophora sp. M221]|nr:hypothetical protein IFR05_013371 [Cadophora sp. M221]
MSATIPTHLAPGKRQMSIQGAIREIDRTIDRAPWVSASGQTLKLISDEEEQMNESLHSDRHRTQEKDRVKAPENALRAAIRPLGWLNKADKPNWQFTSIVHGDKELWNCQLFLGEYLVGTEDRVWKSMFAAKSATSLEALAFLEQQRIAHANCQIRDKETQELILLWPQPFSHEARRDMVTRLTPLDDMDGARDLFTCLREDTATVAYSGVGIYRPSPKSNLQIQSASGENEQHLKATQISGAPKMNNMATQTNPLAPDVNERVNPDIDQIVSHFGALVIRGPGEQFYSEMHQIFLNIQSNAVMQSSDSIQTDILTCNLVQCLFSAYEAVSPGGETRTWNVLEGHV